MNKTLAEYTQEGVAELQQKSLDTIQVETALKWCGRALAARMIGRAENEVTEYAHESIEHAALSGDDTLLRTIRATLNYHNIRV